MIQKIINHMKKYHEANVWIAERVILEGKKQLVSTAAVSEPTLPVYQTSEQQQQVVFTHYDVGHNQDERNRIQELYSELGNLINVPKLAI